MMARRTYRAQHQAIAYNPFSGTQDVPTHHFITVDFRVSIPGKRFVDMHVDCINVMHDTQACRKLTYNL